MNMWVTCNGEPAVVVISDEDYESLVETIAVLSDSGLVAELAQADRDIERGDVHTLEEVAAQMRERGRSNRGQARTAGPDRPPEDPGADRR